MTRTRTLAATCAALLLPLLASAPAEAKNVTKLESWKASNRYLAKADIDGRSQPKLEPRAKTNHVRKGQWVKISCQTTGQSAFGSTVWSKVGRYYVPDQLLKTYTDGRLRGAPSCGRSAPSAPAQGRCTAVTLYGVRGSGEPIAGPYGMSTTVGRTVERAVAQIRRKGRSVRALNVPYEAASVETIISDPSRFQRSMEFGKILLNAMISKRVKQCPRTRIGVVGYSQGAGVASETLRGLSVPALRRVRAVTLFADTYSAGRSEYTVTPNPFRPSDTDADRSGSGILGDRRLPRQIPYKWDVCFVEDLVCDGRKSSLGLLAQASVASVHTRYKDFVIAGFTLPQLQGLLMGRTILR
ncbi:cutinase family protein [Conexibacter sp. W3-3-2]|uniref:cutinase family protein n=1 Tax=Conexibacter sp. W3-3-2 TaxID=2675227 RepID=UPI0012B72E1F|nr:cutinase family protein [Conexibacter sp. W3-3-2]MTD46401.1 cutinase family protein [Conexibacter sp. W3-3-2]